MGYHVEDPNITYARYLAHLTRHLAKEPLTSEQEDMDRWLWNHLKDILQHVIVPFVLKLRLLSPSPAIYVSLRKELGVTRMKTAKKSFRFYVKGTTQVNPYEQFVQVLRSESVWLPRGFPTYGAMPGLLGDMIKCHMELWVLIMKLRAGEARHVLAAKMALVCKSLRNLQPTFLKQTIREIESAMEFRGALELTANGSMYDYSEANNALEYLLAETAPRLAQTGQLNFKRSG